MALHSELLRQPRGKSLDFFSDLSEPEALLQTLVAFSNSRGGKIIIGKNKEGKLTGARDPFAVQQQLLQLVRDHVHPSMSLNISFFTEKNKTLLLVESYPAGLPLLALTFNAKAPQYWTRVADKNEILTDSTVKALEQIVNGNHVLDCLDAKASIQDLDTSKLQEVYGKGLQFDQDELLRLGLMKQSSGTVKLKKGALILFSKANLFRDAFIFLARQGKASPLTFSAQPDSSISVLGGLKQLAASSTEFMIKNKLLIVEHQTALTDLLYQVLLEGLLYADFSTDLSFPIRVSIDGSKVKVAVQGVLLPGHGTEEMMQGYAKVRNKLIAKILVDGGLLKQYGSTIPNLVKEGMAMGVDLQISEKVDGFDFNLGLSSPEAQVNVPKVVDKKTKPNQEQLILGLLSHGPHSSQELLSGLGLKTKTGGFKKIVSALLKSGTIEYTIPEKPRSRNQKYRICVGENP